MRLGGVVKVKLDPLEQALVLLRIFHQKLEKGLVGIAEARQLLGDGIAIRERNGGGLHG